MAFPMAIIASAIARAGVRTTTRWPSILVVRRLGNANNQYTENLTAKLLLLKAKFSPNLGYLNRAFNWPIPGAPLLGLIHSIYHFFLPRPRSQYNRGIWGFTLKTHHRFSFHTALEKLIHHFQNVACLHENQKPSFSNSSGLKSVFEKLCFRDGLVWTIGLTVEIKLSSSWQVLKYI